MKIKNIFLLFLAFVFLTTPAFSAPPMYGGPGDQSNVAITGGTINGATIGATTPAAGAFTTLKATTGAAAGLILQSDASGNLTYTDPAAAANAGLSSMVNPKQMAQGVRISGTGYITVADNTNINPATGNFTIHREMSLSDWAATVEFLAKQTGGTGGYYASVVVTTGLVRLGLDLRAGGGALFSYTSTVAPGFFNNTTHAITIVVTRETASTAGSVVFYADGYQLGASVPITAATPISLVSTAVLSLKGSSTASEVNNKHFQFNRALTAAEVLDLYRNGISFADKWGSQSNRITAVNNRDFSSETIGNWVFEGGGGGDGTCTYNAGPAGEKTGMLTVGATAGTGRYARLKGYDYATRWENYKKYRYEADIYIPAASTVTGVSMRAAFTGATTETSYNADLTKRDQWQRIAVDLISTTGGDDANQWIYLYWAGGATGDVIYFDNVSVIQRGATLALEPSGIKTPKWFDSSTNALDASYPTTGSSLILPYQPGTESLLSITTVSLAADADTTIYTVPTGRRCVLTKAILVVGADAGTSVLSIGQNTAETDWLPNNTLSGLDAANDAAILMPVPNTTPTLIKSYAAGTVIEAKVSSHAGGATNTLYLFGFLY